ncbi:MAG: site-specific integrase [Oceanococcus sp.]|nr:MAG: site-specific integrase [Oceanococcus sp.]
MPKRSAPLTDKQCRQLKYDPETRSANKLRDGDGLFLHVLSTGRKVWRLEYRTAKGTRSEATFPHDYGTDAGTLAKARAWRMETKALVAEGIDPVQQSRANKAARQAAALSTFGASAEEWLAHKSEDWAPATVDKAKSTLENVLLPWLARRPVAEITPQEILHCLQRYERQGKRSTAHNARMYASQIFRRAAIMGLRMDDPCSALRGALKPKDEARFAHLTEPAEIGQCLAAIDNYHGAIVVKFALQLLPLTMLRPGALRELRWSMVNWDRKLLDVPAGIMKATRNRASASESRPHIVPLSRQALTLLNDLYDITYQGDDGGLVFPGLRHRDRPLSENTLNQALLALGYSRSQQVPHGFRHIASTWLNENKHANGWDADAIERALGHYDSSIRGVYNKAEYLPQRTAFMQCLADHFDELKAKKNKLVEGREAVA